MSRTATAAATFALIALAAPSAALAATKDSNHDGLPDSWEQRHHLSLSVDQSTRDQDHDGLNNRGERHRGTDPRKADSDRDGLNDGMEVKTGNNPRKRDSDSDGIRDGRENAGMVESFKGGVLTIKLADGSRVSGSVSDATHTSCDDENETEIENETAVHNHRRGAGKAKAARNGDSGGSSTSSSDPSGHNGNEVENEVENEHAAENEAAGETHHNGGSCSTTGMTPGAAVHEAELNHTSAGTTFSKVSLVS